MNNIYNAQICAKLDYLAIVIRKYSKCRSEDKEILRRKIFKLCDDLCEYIRLTKS